MSRMSKSQKKEFYRLWYESLQRSEYDKTLCAWEIKRKEDPNLEFPAEIIERVGQIVWDHHSYY